LRDKGESTKLKSIDDFNRAQAGGGESAPVLDRLQEIMTELGIEKELFDQVINGMKQELKSKNISDPDSLEAIATDLGSKIKAMMKTIAAEQLRIKD
jgi:phytoene/squalene synthetase